MTELQERYYATGKGIDNFLQKRIESVKGLRDLAEKEMYNAETEEEREENRDWYNYYDGQVELIRELYTKFYF